MTANQFSGSTSRDPLTIPGTDTKHGLVCGCVRLLIASSPADDCDQLISPLQTPSSPQPSSSTTHNQHHAPPAFLQRKSFGHQMVACMTRIADENRITGNEGL